jgi:predicted transcriptional regulator YdeE
MTFNKGFKIIGIAVETANGEGEAMTDLLELWGRFQSENLLERIPNQVSSDIFSIYTDYESDFTGKYTCILGLRVSSLDVIPEGMIGRDFEAQNFKTFLAQGELPNAVVETWKEIWNSDKELNRSYTYDFEVYDDRARNGDQSEVSIYIATK